jgi:hypothetical protein
MRKPAVLGLLGLFTSLVPAFAGTVYVPVAPPRQIGDVTYRTLVAVGNPGGAALRLTTRFIASGHDGTQVATAPAAAIVPAHGTLLLSNVTPAGGEGMLEIAGPETLAVSARLEGASRAGRVVSATSLPVVGADRQIPAGTAAQLQGISRAAAGTLHGFGLINLGTEAAVCTVTAYRSTGSPAGSPTRFTVAPRSHNALPRPLAGFGGSLFTEARLEVRCDAPFYPYAVQLAPGGAAALAIAPSVTLGADLQVAEDPARSEEGGGDERGGRTGGTGEDETTDGGEDAGGTDDATGEAVVGRDQLSFPGLFLNARQGNSYRVFDLPLRQGVRYKRITVEFDLYLNKWVSPLFHGVTALRRNDRTLYYGLILRGDRAKTVLDLGKEELARDSGPWKQRTNYHIRMVTDAQAQRVTLEVLQGGRIVHTISGRMTTRDLLVSGGRKMRVDFGGTKVADGAYFPPFGWKYSNLNVKAEPF